jgi:hypothetical protein
MVESWCCIQLVTGVFMISMVNQLTYGVTSANGGLLASAFTIFHLCAFYGCIWLLEGRSFQWLIANSHLWGFIIPSSEQSLQPPGGLMIFSHLFTATWTNNHDWARNESGIQVIYALDRMETTDLSVALWQPKNPGSQWLLIGTLRPSWGNQTNHSNVV